MALLPGARPKSEETETVIATGPSGTYCENQEALGYFTLSFAILKIPNPHLLVKRRTFALTLKSMWKLPMRFFRAKGELL
jgi:hypothetical protein